MNQKLLLWDVDATLVLTGRAGVVAFLDALGRLHGLEATMDGVDYAGRTDTWIARELLRQNGMQSTQERAVELVAAYLEALEEELPRRQGCVLPGVAEILEETQKREDIFLGLLTGNFRRGAELKLNHYGLWHYFPFGAFADDSELRNDLGPIAIWRAKEIYGIKFAPEQVYIIGDTPHDVECGKVIGAHTISVATGRHSVQELREKKPTAAFETLEDTERFFSTLRKGRALASTKG